MAFLPKYEYDIFISYAHPDGREWVESLCEDLGTELHRRLPGRDKPSIFLDKHDLRVGDRVDGKIVDGIKSSALFLGIVSPRYMDSVYCMRDELGTFQSLNGAASDRIFQVIRIPLYGDPPAPELFWVDCGPKESRAVALDGLVPALVPRLTQIRREMVQLYIAWPSGTKPTEDRRRIEAEFRQQKYVIRPNSVFNEHSRDEAIRRELSDSDVTIHLFDSGDDKLANLQFQIACDLGKPAIVVTRNAEETRRDPADTVPAIHLGDPNAMRHLIERVSSKLGSKGAVVTGAALPVFLLCKPNQDELCAAELTEMLRDHGADVVLPRDPDLDPFLHLDAHVEEMRQSAGVIVCWGKAPREWLDGVENKLAGLRMRDKRLGQLARGKYFAEPPAKEGLPGRNEFIIRTEADLDPFLRAAGARR